LANLICLDTIAIQSTHSMRANSQPDSRTPSNSRAAFSFHDIEKKDKKEKKTETYFLHASILCYHASCIDYCIVHRKSYL
jgi:hypothetical protein